MHNGKYSFSFNLAGKEFIAHAQQGEVVEIQSHSETRISGTGGGGTISTNAGFGYSNTSGSISDINISSTVHNETKLWVKTSEGLEDEWIFPVESTRLSVRKGHQVCLYSMSAPKTRKSLVRKLVNISTRKYIDISTPEKSLKTFNLAHDESIGVYVFGGATIGAFPAMAVGSTGGAGEGVMAFIGAIMIFVAIGIGIQRKKLKKNLTYINSLEDVDNKMMELIFSDTHITPAT